MRAEEESTQVEEMFSELEEEEEQPLIKKKYKKL